MLERTRFEKNNKVIIYFRMKKIVKTFASTRPAGLES